MKVQTTDGLLEREELTVHDSVQETDTGRMIATEWRTPDGRLVRRDGWFNLYRGFNVAGTTQ